MAKNSKIKTQILELDQYKSWDELNQASPQGHFFNQVGYLKLINDFYPQIKILGFFNAQEELIGGLIYRERKRIGIKMALPLPFTPYNGLILRSENQSESDIEKIMIQINNYFSNNKYHKIQIKFSPELQDIRHLIWHGWKEKAQFTYRNNLTDEDKLFNNFSYAIKKQIKKAIRHQVKMVECDDYQLFNYLFTKTFARQSEKSPISEMFLKKLTNLSINDDSGRLMLAQENDGQYSSGLIISWFNDKGYLLFGASHPKLRTGGSTPFLHWEVMKYLKKRGIKTLDWCGANIPSIVKFKRQFNANLTPYFQVTKYNFILARILLKILN